MNLVFNRYEVVYFAVRSVNYGRHEHILQLAAKFERGETFSKWITLPTSVAHSASKIEGLKVENDKMFLRNEDLKPVHLILAIWRFIRFLDSSTKQVILFTYDQATAIPLLVRAILEADQVDECCRVILGYRDSLEDFVKKMPDRRGTGRFALPVLAKDILKEHTRNDSDLLNSLQVLEKLVTHFGLRNQIIQNCRLFQGALEREMEAQYSPQIYRSLVPLKGVLTLGVIKKIAEAGVSLSTLERVLQQKGSKGLERFLSEKQGNGKLRVTDSTEIKQKIIQFFEVGTTSKHNNTGGNETIDDRVNRLEKQQDRVDRENDVVKRERGQAHYPATERENTLYGAIGHIKGSQLSGAHSNPLKKQQDQINREMALLRGKQEQSYEEVDLLRKMPEAAEPVYDVLRKSYTEEQDQVDDGTVTLRRKHHPGNYNSGPSSSKRHAMYEDSPN